MSKRGSNCDHDDMEILPGNRVVCRNCGEDMDPDALDFEDEGNRLGLGGNTYG